MSEWKYVKNHEFFTQMADCGYITVQNKKGKDEGICGYIAAGMLMAYDTLTGDRDYAWDFARYENGRCVISSDLPMAVYKKAQEKHYPHWSTSFEVHHAMKLFLEQKNSFVKHVSLFIPFASSKKVADLIDKDRPVVWFGNIKGTGFHAVLVYGYKKTEKGIRFKAHFGWQGRCEEEIEGMLGSMYTYL